MERVAVIGLSCLLPGAQSPAEFWRNLLEEKILTSEVTAAEMGVDPRRLYDPRPGQRDKYYWLRGGYVRDFSFDPTGYQLPSELLGGLDKTFQWSLHVAREALRDSGYLADAAALERCGVLLGNLSFPTQASRQLILPIYHRVFEAVLHDLLGRDGIQFTDERAKTSPSQLNQLISGYPAAIVAQALALGRVHLGLDAACATSLYAVKLACHYLNSGQADLMLAGAVSSADPAFIHLGFSVFHAYPTEGTASRPLDKASQGLTAAEGAGMLVLKRYQDALRDGDHIYAVIRGVGLSNDGRGKHVLTPNPKGQRLAYERAYAEAGLLPQYMAYVECHATGTPLGDMTELNSMDTFWGQSGAAPLIGAVKANLGHLLTAAGMVGILKTVLSLEHGFIPATPGLTAPLTSQRDVISAAHIVQRARPWPNDSPNRYAAVTAFGFGGTNAHLILEHQREDQPDLSVHQPTVPTKLAIIGMEAFFGSCRDLGSFSRMLYNADQCFIPLPTERWKGIETEVKLLKQYGLPAGAAPQGAYIDGFEMDFLHFRIPPGEENQLFPQQLLMLKVADDAIRDAGLVQGGNVAVIVAMGTDLALHQICGRLDLAWQIKAALARAGIDFPPEDLAELEELIKTSLHPVAQLNQYTSTIGNIIASRIAAQWDFSGPAFTVSAEENSTFRALEIAQWLLTAKEVEAVVVGAVDLSGGVEHVLLRHQLMPLATGRPTLSFDRDAKGWLVGEGAGAVVLKRLDQVHKSSERIYAVLDSLAFTSGTSAAAVAQTCRQALALSQSTPEAVGYLEVSGSGYQPEDEAEIAGLLQAYRGISAGRDCALGSVKANIGHTFAAAGMASLIKTALCLHQRFIPATPGWSGPKDLAQWAGSPFYAATKSQPWLLEQGQTRRAAAVNSLGRDGACAHLVLTEAPPSPRYRDRYLAHRSLSLIPLAGDSLDELLSQIEGLAQVARSTSSPKEIAQQAFEKFQGRSSANYAVALVASTLAELNQEINYARVGMPHAFQTGGEWQTPVGSCFAARPLGRAGSIAFVYPGAFSSYPGLGRDLFHLFPALHDSLHDLIQSGRPASLLKALYPRELSRLTEEQVEQHRGALRDDAISMIESGVFFALLYTRILRDIFKVQPAAAFGFSLGESTMLHAWEMWADSEAGSARLRSSNLFKTQLSGPQTIVRDFWNATKVEWQTYVVIAPAERIAAALESEPQVYLTLVNTPSEAVIAGDPQACQRLIQSLKCEALPAPYNYVIHCRPMQAAYEEFVRLNHFPVRARPEVTLYSAARYAPLTQPDSDSLARQIATVACQPVDFPRLVRRVYADGVRLFIEVGPDRACSRWIETILSGQTHIAQPINRRDVDDHTALLALLARLVAQRVALDLTSLYSTPQTAPAAPTLNRWVSLGDAPIRKIILNEPNLHKFGTPPPPVDLPQPEPLQRFQPESSVHSLSTAPAWKNLTLEAPLLNTARVHMEFLRARQLASQHMGQLLKMQLELLKQRSGEEVAPIDHSARSQSSFAPSLSPPSPGALSTGLSNVESSPIVWDEADLLEFAAGKIAHVFGPEYAAIDAYTRRVRLPLPPYLLVNRVTRLHAARGRFEPSTITTEYDIPHGAWYSVDGQIPGAVAVEAGQCDLLLISYLGIDFENKGELVYRLLDCTLTFLDDLPKEGDVLRYDIAINSFVRSGDNLLFFFSYECFVGERMVLKMTGGCAGFFSDEDLERGRGVVLTKDELDARRLAPPRTFTPCRACDRASFDRADLLALTRGDLPACFGPTYVQAGRNPSLRLPPEAMLMIDRVVSVEPNGGCWGLGSIVAEKDLDPTDWYFPCHFKDDQVLAGSLMAEGCTQVLQFYLLYLGLHTQTIDARFQPIPNLPQVVRCRGQATPAHHLLIYKLEVTDIGLSPQPYAKANVDIILDGVIIVSFTDLGLQLVEKNPLDAHQIVRRPRPALFNETHLEAFARGAIAGCFGPEFAMYHNRRAPRTPNGHLQLLNRVTAIDAQRLEFEPGASLVAEYDALSRPWFYEANTYPTLPYSILMEIALQPCGFLSAYLGSTLLFPEEQLYFRNLDGQGHLRRAIAVRGKTIVNRVHLLSSTFIQGVIIQKFGFQLECDEECFYEGEAAFGYFTPEALANQTGLDSGKQVSPWGAEKGSYVDLGTLTHVALYQHQRGKPHYRLAAGKLNFLDEVWVLAGGGQHSQGYVYAAQAINPHDWFFANHFYQDPVMPGSLGVEAILQAMQVYALRTDLGQAFRNPHFEEVIDDHTTVWKYRGQIVPTTRQMQLEAHITRLERQVDRVRLVADASLWRDGLRIYAIHDLALNIVETAK